MDALDPQQRSKEALARARQQRDYGEADMAGYLYAHALEWAESVDGRLGLAWSAAQSGSLELAMAECRKALVLDPDDGRSSNDLGVYLTQLGEDQRAIGHFQRALSAPSNSERHFTHYNLGLLFERRRDWPLAADSYQAALQLSPELESARRALERVKRRMQPAA